MHTHVLFQHVLPGKGLSTLLTGMAFHTYKQTQQCLKALAHPERGTWAQQEAHVGCLFRHVPWESLAREGPEDLEWTQVGQEDMLQVAGEAREKQGHS